MYKIKYLSQTVEAEIKICVHSQRAGEAESPVRRSVYQMDR